MKSSENPIDFFFFQKFIMCKKNFSENKKFFSRKFFKKFGPLGQVSCTGKQNK